MAESMISNLVWLINTIENKGKTFEEIQVEWAKTHQGDVLNIRTFHRWKVSIAEMLGCEIQAKRIGHKHVYFFDVEKYSDRLHYEFVLDALLVGQIINKSKDVIDKIILEQKPSGRQFIESIIRAFREQKVLRIAYQKHGSTRCDDFTIHPYLLKLYKNRWYLLAYNTKRQTLRAYALDCMKEVVVTRTTIRYFKNAKDVIQQYHNCIGIESTKSAEVVKLKTYGSMVEYLQAFPMHQSQEYEGKGVFKYYIQPEKEFILEVLSHGTEVEIIQPQWLRKEMKHTIAQMASHYTRIRKD